MRRWWAPIRAKQLSMAATVGVIWLGACVSYWSYRRVCMYASVHNLVSLAVHVRCSKSKLFKLSIYLPQFPCMPSLYHTRYTHQHRSLRFEILCPQRTSSYGSQVECRNTLKWKPQESSNNDFFQSVSNLSTVKTALWNCYLYQGQ